MSVWSEHRCVAVSIGLGPGVTSSIVCECGWSYVRPSTLGDARPVFDRFAAHILEEARVAPEQSTS